MTPQRWEQVKAIVSAAAERATADRPAYVSAACGDDTALRRTVESLLAVPDDFMPSPLVDLSDGFDLSVDDHDAPGEELPPGTRLGPYEIDALIDAGGMGAVYRAVRADGEFRHVVAIKVIQRGMSSAHVLRRFRIERQILANLNHPNIAKLLDGGSADGRPYLVMEFVDGVPIDAFCAAHDLSISDRLKLFRRVCDAVQYAHRHLVVHRDLKPANILVAPDGTPTLLDFGIAKLLQGEGDTPLTQTHVAQRPMTPEYASPEQVRGDAITTATDVFALGIVLFELLTRRRPFNPTGSSPAALLDALTRHDVARPSALAGDARTKKQLRGDLDTIVLTALQRDPERRYASVEQLSDDIRRHLEGLPITARQESAAYRARKFAARHRLALAAAMLVLLSIVGGGAVAAWQAAVATRERNRAMQRFNDVRSLARALMFDVHDEFDQGPVNARTRLVAEAAKYLDRLMSDAGDDVALLHELASGYERMAVIQGNAFRGGQLGDAAAAAASLRNARSLRARIAVLAPSHFENRRDLAGGIDLSDALRALQEGRSNEAIATLQDVASRLEILVAERPADIAARHYAFLAHYNLGLAYGSTGVAGVGNRALSLEHHEEAARIGEELLKMDPATPIRRSNLLAALDSIVGWYQSEGQLAEARKRQERLIPISESLVRDYPDSQMYQRELAALYGNVASLAVANAEYARALEFAEKSQPLYERIAARDGANLTARRDVAVGARNLGRAFTLNKRPADAVPHLRNAISLFSEAAAKDPRDAYVQRQLALTHLHYADAVLLLEGPEAALPHSLKGIEIAETLVSAQPSNVTAWRTLALLRESAGRYHRVVAERGSPARWTAARDYFRQSRDAWREIERVSGPLSAPDARSLAGVDAQLADVEKRSTR